MTEQNVQGTGIARRGETGVGRYSPWNEFAEMKRQMDDLFGRAFGYTPLSRLIPGEASTFEPDIDIFETEDKVKVYCSLPGYRPQDINVEVTGDTVSIQGERQPYAEHDKARHYHRGWSTGNNQFTASFTLPCEVEANKVKATFRDGILNLEMPKTETARTKAIKVNVQPG